MSKNKSFIKLGLTCLASIGLMISVSSAYTLKINAGFDGNEFYSDKILPIHFADNGNDFGGLMYFTNDWNSNSSEDTNDEPECVEDGEGNVPDGCACIERDDEDNCTKYVYNPAGALQYTYKVTAGSDTYDCAIQVNGFYYNAERGDRLWPMDSNTAHAWGLDTDPDSDFDMEGGIYTRCKKAGYDDFFASCLESEDPQQCIQEGQGEFYDAHSYYGTIKHTIRINDVLQKFYLVAGLNYEEGNPWIEISTDKLSPTFQRKDNKYPLGLIYDYNGGVGFVGCMVKDKPELKKLINRINNAGDDREGIEEFFSYNRNLTRAEGMIKYIDEDDVEGNERIDCTNVGSAADSLIGMIIEGLIGMGTNTDADSIVGNSTSDKMQLFSSVNVNNSTLINFSKQKAEELCRGKWNKGESKGIICIDKATGGGDILAEKGKTYIVKGKNVIIKPEESLPGTNSPVYDIFIDGGSLIIDENSAKSFVIKRNGFYGSTTSPADFKSAVQAARPESTEELVDFIYDGDEVAVASIIRGNFIVDGEIKGKSEEGTLNNKYFIYGKFTTNQTYDDLANIFKWRCQGGTANNLEADACPRYAEKSPYQGAFLVVIDQNYNSPLYW